mmetsp:Transcript_20522/g.54453  ORF Transcript_20522/g.54453 Transcript_20522/m.54453 type:complete len:484 (+) Transcript_20522:101-1552(+)
MGDQRFAIPQSYHLGRWTPPSMPWSSSRVGHIDDEFGVGDQRSALPKVAQVAELHRQRHADGATGLGVVAEPLQLVVQVLQGGQSFNVWIPAAIPGPEGHALPAGDRPVLRTVHVIPVAVLAKGQRPAGHVQAHAARVSAVCKPSEEVLLVWVAEEEDPRQGHVPLWAHGGPAERALKLRVVYADGRRRVDGVHDDADVAAGALPAGDDGHLEAEVNDTVEEHWVRRERHRGEDVPEATDGSLEDNRRHRRKGVIHEALQIHAVASGEEQLLQAGRAGQRARQQAEAPASDSQPDFHQRLLVAVARQLVAVVHREVGADRVDLAALEHVDAGRADEAQRVAQRRHDDGHAGVDGELQVRDGDEEHVVAGVVRVGRVLQLREELVELVQRGAVLHASAVEGQAGGGCRRQRAHAAVLGAQRHREGARHHLLGGPVRHLQDNEGGMVLQRDEHARGGLQEGDGRRPVDEIAVDAQQDGDRVTLIA